MLADNLATMPRASDRAGHGAHVLAALWCSSSSPSRSWCSGLFPNQEQALYLTAVGLGLFMGAIGLFVAVFWQRRPSVAADAAALPASRGSSA